MSLSPARCPYCGAPLVRTEEGSLVCTNGHVIEEASIDLGPEWRAFTPEERLSRSRVGAPLTERLHDRGVTTGLGVTRDPRAAKLAALQARLRASDSRMVEAFRELNAIASRLELPTHAVETAGNLLRRLLAAGGLGGRRMREAVAAVVLVACRLCGVGISLREAASTLGIDMSKLARAYRLVIQKLGVRVAPRAPSDELPRLTQRLGLPPAAELLAARLLAALKSKGLTQGKPPLGLAAAALYLSSILLDTKRNQADVAKAAGVTDATIRNRYRDIVDNLYIEVNL